MDKNLDEARKLNVGHKVLQAGCAIHIRLVPDLGFSLEVSVKAIERNGQGCAVVTLDSHGLYAGWPVFIVNLCGLDRDLWYWSDETGEPMGQELLVRTA